MAYKITFMNNKGGVGKTVLTVNLGAALTAVPNDKSRVLIIDVDPQGNATLTFSNPVLIGRKPIKRGIWGHF